MTNTCPLTGLPTNGVFFSGADATAASILNKVLAGEMTLEEMEDELQSDRFKARGSNPQRFRQAIEKAQAAGVEKIDRPRDFF